MKPNASKPFGFICEKTRHALLATSIWCLLLNHMLVASGYAQEIQTATTIDKIVAQIDNHIVLKSELEQQYLGAQQNQAGMSQCDVLESLIMNKIMVCNAELDSIELSEDQLESTLDQRMAQVVGQIGTAQRVEELYGKSIRTLKEELREAVREQMLIQALQQQLFGDLKISPEEVRRFFRRTPRSELPYYSAEVQLAEIVRIAKASSASEAETEARLLELRARLLKGEDFETLARVYSDDPSVERNGGHLGFFRRGELAPAYEAAALQLEPEAISRPIKSSFGFHLIKLEEIRGNTYDSWHILLIPTIYEQDLQPEIELLDSLRTEILAGRKQFEPIAKEHSENPQTAFNGGFLQNPRDGGRFIAVDALEPLLFFLLDTLAVGSITPPLPYKTPDGKDAIRILYYKDKISAHAADFNKDYTKLQRAALQEKRGQKMDNWLRTAHKGIYVHIDADYRRCPIYARIKQKKNK